MRLFSQENPMGKTVLIDNQYPVVIMGVMKDFIIGSPFQPVPPMLIGGPAGWFNTMYIKFNHNNRLSDNLSKTEQVFKQFNPNYPFEYQFVDEEYARKFRNIQRIGIMATGFAGLTIVISCLGLFALVAYMAVGFQAIKAAMADPVISIKSE